MFSLPELKKSEDDYNNTEIPQEDRVESYYKIRQQLNKLAKEIQAFLVKPKYSLPFMQPGRMVKVCH